MKTTIDNKFRTLSREQLNETIGGYYIIITLPDGRIVRVKVDNER